MSRTRRFDNRHDGNDKVRGIGEQWSVHARSPIWPPHFQRAGIYPAWVCHQRACFGYCIEPVSLALSASLVNKLLRCIGIPISSYDMASDQVQTLSRALQCKDRDSLCCLPEAKPLPTSLKSELPRAVRPLFTHFQTHVSRRDISVCACLPAPKLCKTTQRLKVSRATFRTPDLLLTSFAHSSAPLLS